MASMLPMALRSVCAVVLTYDRRALLGDCIEAIEAQTRPVERIVVVDNGSQDGSAAMLRERWPGRVEVHRLPTNVGAAGGFAHALRQGHASGCDAVWLMDDDVIAAPDALQRLLDGAALLADTGIATPYLVSSAQSPLGLATNVPDLDERRNALDYPDWPRLLAHGLVPVTRATFVSILLPRGTIEAHGLPIAEMFIWGEDSEYTRRITRERPGWLVGASRVEHVRAAAGRLDIRTENDPVRIGWHACRLRNDLYMARRALGRRRLLPLLWREACGIARLALQGDLRRARVLARGFVDGLRFDPPIPALEPALQPSSGQAASLAEIVETGKGQAMPS